MYPECWDQVAAELRSLGHSVEVVELPGRHTSDEVHGHTLDDYSLAVEKAIRARPAAPLVLVGHSFGGIVATQAAEREAAQVDTLVYLAAFVPRPGAGLVQVASVPKFSTSLAMSRAVLDESGRVQTMPAEHAWEVLFNDLDEPAAREVAARLVPEELGLQMTVPEITSETQRSFERTYIECTRDNAIPVLAQRVMADAAGITDIRTLEADHSPFYSQPSALVEALTS
jgi:alpha-beta hydrolase superfamily lysophospholipase